MKLRTTIAFCIISIATSVAIYILSTPLPQDVPTTKIDNTEKIKTIANLFEDGAIIKGPDIVDCTLSSRTKTKCFSITVDIAPTGFKPGPWCPRNINESAEKGGIWIKDGQVHDVDGTFIQNMANTYNDKKWQLFDPKTGKINVTDTSETCPAAARPDVDASLQNHCVECETSYLREGANVTYTIPLTPVPSRWKGETRFNGVGVSFSGTRFDGPAPIDAILGAYTIAPFDDCGGHVNMHVGYHIHAVKGCTKEHKSTNHHAPIIGYAMDGYPLHAQKDEKGHEPKDLDKCRGHKTDELGYHYHADDPGKNAIIPCFSGENGCTSEDPDAPCDASIKKRPPPPAKKR